jgi:hypothetical protein
VQSGAAQRVGTIGDRTVTEKQLDHWPRSRDDRDVQRARAADDRVRIRSLVNGSLSGLGVAINQRS